MHEMIKWASWKSRASELADSTHPPEGLGEASDSVEFSEQFWKLTSSSQIFPKVTESMGLNLSRAEFRTTLASEERAVSLQELKRISSDALLASRHGWEDPRTGMKVSSSILNLYHFSYYHVLPKTAPQAGLLLEVQPHTSQIHHWRSLCGQQISQQTGRPAELPSACGTILRADLQNGVLTICVRLTQGRFASEAGAILLGDAELGSLLRVECQNSCSYKEYLSPTPCKPTWYCPVLSRFFSPNAGI